MQLLETNINCDSTGGIEFGGKFQQYNVLYKTSCDSSSPAVALEVPYLDSDTATYVTQDVATRILRKKLETLIAYEDDGWARWDARDCCRSTSATGLWEWSTCNSSSTSTVWVKCRFTDWGEAVKYADAIKPKTAEQRLAEIIKTRQAPMIITGRNRLSPTDRKVILPSEDIREQRARETLLRVIGPDKFRSFLRNGFVTARNPRSGRVYQIFPGHGITCVYENGNMIERLCVVLRGDFPPTDSVIVRYLMALNNEDQLWGLAVKHGISTYRQATLKVADTRSLPEIYADLQGRKSA